MPFTELDLHPLVMDGIADLRFTEMTPIQEETIPLLLEGNDLIAAAQTGTGKTAAFLIPLIDHLIDTKEGKTRGLILTPTRELALQIDGQMNGLSFHAGVSSTCIVGGLDFAEQERAIRRKMDVLIATPGRLIDHMRYDHIDFSTIEYVVLDEADRMLDIGFLPDIRKIFKSLPEDRQTLLFSATMGENVNGLARDFLKKPKMVKIGKKLPAHAIRQKFYSVSQHLKEGQLLKLLRGQGMDTVLVFARTKKDVRSLESKLYRSGYNSDCLHGDMEQEERNAALDRFRRGEVSILVATDVASRGLDIPDVSHVINFDVPADPDDYIHRVGRTARAEKDGDAITFVSQKEHHSLQKIEKALSKKIQMENLGPRDSRSENKEPRNRKRFSSSRRPKKK